MARISSGVGLAVVVALAVGVGCFRSAKPTDEPDDVPPIDVPAEDLKALVEGNNQFAIELYKQVAAKQDGNLILSPYSISSALAMTYAGARGQTAEEMKTVLHFTLPHEKLHPAFHATAYQLRSRKDQPFQLSIANGLWGQGGFQFQADFLDLTRKHYAAGFHEVDFKQDPDGSRRGINHWVEEKTQDKIKELLKKGIVTKQTRLILVNAIYFKGQWEKRFDPRLTTDDRFRAAPNRTVPVRMMRQHGEFGYAESADAQILELRYRPNQEAGLAMVIVLPKAVDGLARLEAQLSGPQIQKWFGSMVSRPGQVFLPVFQTRSRFSLQPNLHELGMRLPFDPERADFHGLVRETENFFISDVIQEAMVEVNEEGTVAAAATAVVGDIYNSAPARPFTFRADHPFLFLVCVPRTGTVLFIGRFGG